ncbi:hypothetical protein BGZ70_000606 [Mortierella alpina]|uniref:RING-type domain-containing protein n=1 Tax=Mortierella alpina TaxID=64518 RepID=A0A9P6LYX3_MORAP|nr:hypothetical protein BGZ70_000606 [Mortierella alpina]
MSHRTAQYNAPEERHRGIMNSGSGSSMDTYTDLDVDPHRVSARREHRSPSLEGGSQNSRPSSMDLIVDADHGPERITPSAPGSYAAPSSSSSTTPIKRAKRNPSVKCPLCHEYVAPGQYQQHYRMELSNLDAGHSQEGTRGKRGAAIAATKQFSKGKSRGSASDNEKRGMLRDIQKRRSARQNNKDSALSFSGAGRRPLDLDLGLAGVLGDGLGGGSGDSGDSPATCFICNERLFGSLDDINAHIDACLTNPQPAHHAGPSGASNGGGGYTSSGANTPVSGGVSGVSSTATTPNERMADSFEEYTWAGQTRVRATALFEGGMGSLGSISRSAQEDTDDDLNVEDDEEDEYGDAQFTERDVVSNDADPDVDELREIVMASSSPLDAGKVRRRHRADRDVDIEDEGEEDLGDVDEDEEMDEDEEIDLEGDDDDEADEEHRVNALISSAFASGDTRLVIDALRAKIKHLESANKNVPSCLICLEPYTVPLTSIVCWHVHCEACWMQTLGSKKLCPQCQKITLPKDLRRIYL